VLVRGALITFMIGICFETAFAGEVRHIKREDLRVEGAKPIDSRLQIQRPILSVGPNDIEQGENAALSLEDSDDSDDSNDSDGSGGSKVKGMAVATDKATTDKAASDIDLQSQRILATDLDFPKELPPKRVNLPESDSVVQKSGSQTDNGGEDKPEEKPEDKTQTRGLLRSHTPNSVKENREGESSLSQDEAKIPVLTASTTSREHRSGGTTSRLLLSLGLVLTLAIAIGYGAKYWTRKRLGYQDQTKIQILSQYHLGPKKSLVIVQVAGESLLLGVTDQSINLIKPLALIDDEIPTTSPSHFLGELEQFSNLPSMGEVRDRVQIQSSQNRTKEKSTTEDVNLKSIQTMITSRLREMRTL
jgi:flagellar protein FliO/FliZ